MRSRIALVYDAVYPYSKGGAERRFHEIGKGLSALGHEVHLYGMKYWSGPDIIEEGGIYLHGICPTMELYTKSGRRAIWQAVFFGLHCFKLLFEDFDVIDCCGFPYFSLFACKLVSVVKRIPLFCTWHEVWGKAYWREYLGRLGVVGYSIERLAARMPDTIVADSQAGAEQIGKQLGFTRHIHVVPNGVSLEEISSARKATGNYDVIYAGRLVDYKNVDVLIRAIDVARTVAPTIKCVIVGDGPARASLESLTRQLNLQNCISFLGFLSDVTEVYALMKASRVFVLPSMREGFGIVVVEANACGLPVITVDQNANFAKHLIIEGVNGTVCPLDHARIASEILKVLVRTPEDYGASCRDIAGQFTWAEMARSASAAYQLSNSATRQQWQ